MKNLKFHPSQIVTGIAVCLFLGCINSNSPPTTTTAPGLTDNSVERPNTEQQGKSFAITTEAFYQGTMQSANSPGILISLYLTPQGNAKLLTDFRNKGQVMVDTGAWKTLTNGNLSLTLRRLGLRDSTRLELEPDDERLIHASSDKDELKGLILYSKPMPAAEAND